jgi:hypothetical protein
LTIGISSSTHHHPIQCHFRPKATTNIPEIASGLSRIPASFLYCARSKTIRNPLAHHHATHSQTSCRKATHEGITEPVSNILVVACPPHLRKAFMLLDAIYQSNQIVKDQSSQSPFGDLRGVPILEPARCHVNTIRDFLGAPFHSNLRQPVDRLRSRSRVRE